MKLAKWTQRKVLVTSIVTVWVFALLSWEYFHGGVVSHHILMQKDLPAISNWWNGLLLPILTWVLASRVERRLNRQKETSRPSNKSVRKIVGLFLLGLVLGVLLSVSFVNDYKPFLENVLYLIIILSFFIPIYYSEFILGFILGMTYTFGVIIPTVFILLFALIGLVTYRLIRPAVLKLVAKIGNGFNRTKQ